jgi:hypothetical protein
MTTDAVRHGMRVLTLPSVLFTAGLAGHAFAGGDTPAASVLVPLLLLTVRRGRTLPGTISGVAGWRTGAVTRCIAAARRHRPGHDDHAWRGYRCGEWIRAGKLPPDDAPRRRRITWFCAVADEWRAPGHVVGAPGRRDRGRALAGGWRARLLDVAGTHSTTSRQRVARGHGRRPRRRRRCRHLYAASAWLGLAVCGS